MCGLPDATAQKGDIYESEDGLKWKNEDDNAGINGFHPVSFGDKLVFGRVLVP